MNIIYRIMMFLFLMILAFQLAYPIKSMIGETRAPAGLNCTNPDNTLGTKLTCTVVDLQLFIFIFIIFELAAEFMVARFELLQ
jgi:hypothetical protein